MNFIKDDIIIHKGSPQIYIYRKGDAEPLQNGSYARKGDLLQIAYQTDAEAFGIILSIDGRGTVTLHFPDNASGSTKLTLNEKTALGNSYELDDAPEFERFFFITSESPLNTKSILRAAEELARNKFNVLNENIKITGITDNSIRQMSITIKK